eukprot:TRINITY_DN893_c0_g2_i2.p1 TRINITY_DN893_c0_g2~~TRINITY_DN893_c0_g2_i2.p1  ORF type:complete len:252 (+),score=66.04 TRINITY_DN893_c0_g2_i2:69-824(+)
MAEGLLAAAGALPSTAAGTCKGTGGGMLVFVADGFGKTLPVDVTPQDTVADLMASVSQMTGSECPRLRYQDRTLPPDELLADCGLSAQCTVQMEDDCLKWLRHHPTLSKTDDGMTLQHTSSDYRGAIGSVVTSGTTWRIEFEGDTNGSTVGVVHPNDVGLAGHVYTSEHAWVYNNHGDIHHNETVSSLRAADGGYRSGDSVKMQLLIDGDVGTLKFWKNDEFAGELNDVVPPVSLWCGLYSSKVKATLVRM